jgi:hypothetical protein
VGRSGVAETTCGQMQEHGGRCCRAEGDICTHWLQAAAERNSEAIGRGVIEAQVSNRDGRALLRFDGVDAPHRPAELCTDQTQRQRDVRCKHETLFEETQHH